MNSKFTDEQIKAYAAAFRVGDAIWCDGKWNEVVENKINGDNRITAHVDGNNYVINDGGDKEYYSEPAYGFMSGKNWWTNENPYRVTTLDDYELQGGEKIVCLGKDIDLTFGKSYTVQKPTNDRASFITDDAGDMVRTFSYHFNSVGAWGIIPSYEQVKNKEKEDDGVTGVKVVEVQKYSGKFKVGDEVKIVAVTNFENTWGQYSDDVGKTGVITIIDKKTDYNYCVLLNTGGEEWFNEVTLELVKDYNEIKRNDDAFDALRYAAELYAETTSKSATHVSDSMLKLSRTSDEVNRPASSHYHTNNNGNDVWQFADDNLSDERVKGFHQINAIKYVSRYNKKHDTKEKRIEDLEKAKVSIDKLIELEEEE